MGKGTIFGLGLLLAVGMGNSPVPAADGARAADPSGTGGAQGAAIYRPAKRRKSESCVERGARPDPECTPGSVMTANLDVICHQATRERRHVDMQKRRSVYAEYGYSYPQARGAFEVDHLIPLELGGRQHACQSLAGARPAAPRLPGKGRGRESSTCRGVLRADVRRGCPAGDRGELARRVAHDRAGGR